MTLESRALAAYFRTGNDAQPANTEVVEHAGLQYVVLSNIRGVLAVYRVTNRGDLKRLKRWPAALG